MAELVDAPASGAGAGNGVEVRVLFRAPFVCSDAFFLIRMEPPRIYLVVCMRRRGRFVSFCHYHFQGVRMMRERFSLRISYKGRASFF